MASARSVDVSIAGAWSEGEYSDDMRCVGGSRWRHMYDAYPEEIVNFAIQDAWKKDPVSLEACWVRQRWKNEGWDVDYIVASARSRCSRRRGAAAGPHRYTFTKSSIFITTPPRSMLR